MCRFVFNASSEIYFKGEWAHYIIVPDPNLVKCHHIVISSLKSVQHKHGSSHNLFSIHINFAECSERSVYRG